jgi:hypothetical protein
MLTLVIDYSATRKALQEFMKHNPHFEKLKGFKSNFGPLLDKAEAMNKQSDALAKQFSKILNDVKAIQEKGLASELAKKLAEAESLNEKFSAACKQTQTALAAAGAALGEYSKLAANSGDTKMKNDFTSVVGPVLKKLHDHPEVQPSKVNVFIDMLGPCHEPAGTHHAFPDICPSHGVTR